MSKEIYETWEQKELLVYIAVKLDELLKSKKVKENQRFSNLQVKNLKEQEV